MNGKQLVAPPAGPAYEKRKECKRKVSEHVSKCRARLERKAIQQRDDMFQSYHPQRFKTWSPRTQGTNLSINGSRVTDLPSVLSLWADHFSDLGASRCASDPNFDTYVSSVADLVTKSFTAQHSVFNCPIVQEEVSQATNHQKCWWSRLSVPIPSEARWSPS